MRRSVLLAVALLAVGACAQEEDTTPGGGATSGAQARTVTIALGGPFSKTEKPTGDQIRAGARLAADQINGRGGISDGPLKGARIAFREFDDADDPARAADNLRAIADDQSLLAFAGSGLSDASVAAAPVASRAGVPYLSVYASSPKILEAATAEKSVFVVPPTFPAYAFSVMDELVKAGHKKPGIIHLSGTYGDGIADLSAQRLRDKGVTPVAKESFTSGDTDFRTQLAKIKAAGADSLVMVGLAKSDAQILRQADQLGLKLPAFDPGGITNSDTFLKDAGPLANGVVGNTPSDAQRTTEAARKLREDYTKATRESVVPDPAAFAYEAVLALEAAFADGASGRKDLVDRLHRISLPDTGVGPLRFAPDGARLGGRLYIFKVSDGKPQFTTGYEQTGPTEIREVPLER